MHTHRHRRCNVQKKKIKMFVQLHNRFQELYREYIESFNFNRRHSFPSCNLPEDVSSDFKIVQCFFFKAKSSHSSNLELFTNSMTECVPLFSLTLFQHVYASQCACVCCVCQFSVHSYSGARVCVCVPTIPSQLCIFALLLGNPTPEL